MKSTKRQQQASILRIARKIHRSMGAVLFIFFFIISITGLLLGWKKNSGGYLLPNSIKGTSTNLKEWLSIDSLHTIATTYFLDSVAPGASIKLERIDIRNEKGMVKFVFEHNYMGLQLDGVTGNILLVEKRRSDFVENIHDGSILDKYLGTGNAIKLFYTSVMGIALLLFTITGFWLWYGPKRMRKEQQY
jgi:uncharacterized iron-regulated membrane protein